MISYLKNVFERCLNEDGVNSRLMFFLHGVVTSIGLGALVIGFIVSEHKEGYDMMIMAVGGSGAAAAAGRFLTKKGPPSTEGQ